MASCAGRLALSTLVPVAESSARTTWEPGQTSLEDRSSHGRRKGQVPKFIIYKNYIHDLIS